MCSLMSGSVNISHAGVVVFSGNSGNYGNSKLWCSVCHCQRTKEANSILIPTPLLYYI